MQPNHAIKSKEELLNHFGSFKQLEILDQEQMKNLLALNISPEVWENESNRNLISFSQEFVQQTKEFAFNGKNIELIHLLSFLANLTELNLQNNQISDISSISKLTNMKKLYINSNCIENISALQSFTDLTHLGLSKNKLTSYTLALPNLVELLLGYNKLQDKSGLQHSPKLEILQLSGTETTDLHTIPPQLFGLKVLYLLSNNLMEISYLSNFVDLQSLRLGNNKQLQNTQKAIKTDTYFYQLFGDILICYSQTYICYKYILQKIVVSYLLRFSISNRFLTNSITSEAQEMEVKYSPILYINIYANF
ncbi:leucine-rich_repeat domain-containing protein [Hexamita inflata]|uniref:Leucine-rich_repeat domain-containing protein n=1 Tax=Hexamita inflata TaxID=28002 RepID=A0ABP1K2B1_9EUKA